MILLNYNYCTDFLITLLCITLLSTILSLIIFKFPLVVKISFLFVGIYELISYFKPVYIYFTTSDNLKTEGKLKIIRDNMFCTP